MEDKLRVAFRLNGGMGTFIVEMNFIQCFFDLFSDIVDISVFSFAEEVSSLLYGEQYFVSYFASRKEFVAKDYDLSVELNWFPLVLHCDDKKIEKLDQNGNLYALPYKSFIDSGYKHVRSQYTYVCYCKKPKSPSSGRYRRFAWN